VCMYKGSGHSTFVTGHSVLRHGQSLHTSKHGQAHTIQIAIVRAHARDLTMAAAGHAYGMARAAPGISEGSNIQPGCDVCLSFCLPVLPSVSDNRLGAHCNLVGNNVGCFS